MCNSCPQALPETIGGLVSLTTLKASNNLLEGLPESIGQCTSLVTLDLERNKLWELPTEVLAGMTKLTNLELRHNKLCVGAHPAQVPCLGCRLTPHAVWLR